MRVTNALKVWMRGPTVSVGSRRLLTALFAFPTVLARYTAWGRLPAKVCRHLQVTVRRSSQLAGMARARVYAALAGDCASWVHPGGLGLYDLPGS